MTALGVAAIVAYALGSAALDAWIAYRVGCAVERIVARFRGEP